MRFLNYRGLDGRVRMNWLAVAVTVVLVPALWVGAVEAVWYLLTASFSPLMGGFALVAGFLTVVRLVGEALHEARYLRQTIF